MRLAVLQLAARFDRLAESLGAARALATAGPADLIVLPEASLTGYVGFRDGAPDFDLTRFAEPLEGPSFAAIAALARAADAFVAAPLIEDLGDGRVANAFVVVDRTGARVAHYRKRHPWMPETWATAGDAPPPLFEVDGVRVTLAICFDVHFLDDEPDACARLAEADLFLFPSAWVEEDDSREPMLAALARRHQLAIANANWARGDVGIPGQGASRIVSRQGVTLAVAGASESRIDAEITPAR